jgi:hypothetical protein
MWRRLVVNNRGGPHIELIVHISELNATFLAVMVFAVRSGAWSHTSERHAFYVAEAGRQLLEHTRNCSVGHGAWSSHILNRRGTQSYIVAVVVHQAGGHGA